MNNSIILNTSPQYFLEVSPYVQYYCQSVCMESYLYAKQLEIVIILLVCLIVYLVFRE